MVIGIAIYKFELNPTAEGEIEPQFNIIASQSTQDYAKLSFQQMISVNDLFAIFFNHTTGASKETKINDANAKNYFVGRLKENPYKVVSYYRQEVDSSQYLAISFFKLDEDAELFEGLIRQLGTKLDTLYLKLAQGNLRDISFVTKIKETMESEIKFTLFQISRLSNLDKIQKIALIYATPERARTLEILREGPVSRRALSYDLEKIKSNPNIDIILMPFLELNIVRRDWARGTKDSKTGIVQGEGEFIFLTKDVALVRRPPASIVTQIKRDSKLRVLYEEKINEFYSTYDPFVNLDEESRFLAKYLLDPDMFDFLGLLKEKYFPMEKIPKITSEFASSKQVLEELRDGGVVAFLRDPDTRADWIVLLGEITPLVVFPEYVVGKIKDRVASKGQEIDDTDVNAPITTEVAHRGLELLESTYNDKLLL